MKKIFIKLWRQFVKEPEKPTEKDPSDHTNKGSCGNWKVDQYYCIECKMSVPYQRSNILMRICPHCGQTPIRPPLLCQRVYRKIFIKESWKWQVKYWDGSEIIKELSERNITTPQF